MKIRRSIFLFIVIMAALIALVLWFGKKKPVETPPIISVETNAAPPAATMPSQLIQTNAPASKPTTNAVQAQPQSKWEQIQPILATQNDIPIVFYGRLEDQFGNPVTGAQIAASVRIYNGVQSTVERFSVTSDANGFFQINHGKGESLAIVPDKAGYVLATKATLFKYSHLESHPYVSDQNNPTVIKMWKLQGAENLVHVQNEIRVPIDGSPVALDLETGKQVQSGGDIVIQVQSTLNPNVVQKYDWQVTIEAVNGGLISSGDDFEQMFQAPESGYDSQFVAKYQKDVRPWSTTFNGIFYFTSRSGNCYGKLGIEVLSDVVKNGTIPVILNSYANPVSSRNLEIAAPQ